MADFCNLCRNSIRSNSLTPHRPGENTYKVLLNLKNRQNSSNNRIYQKQNNNNNSNRMINLNINYNNNNNINNFNNEEETIVDR